MPVDRDAHDANRRSWNAATRAHNAHKHDQAGFLRDGGELLFPEELDLLGPLDGRRLVHLQCNAGQDSLCLARRGADVVGVDISDEAIAFAQGLSDASGIEARFVRSDVFDWLADAPEAAFDLAFTSYGVLVWLSDLGPWARGIARILKPGGALVVVEYHPFMWMFGEELQFEWPYSSRETIPVPDGVGDYVGRSGELLAPSGFVETAPFENPHPSLEYAHGIGDVLGAILSAGLRLERFEEYPYSNGCKLFPTMSQEGRRFRLDAVPTLPLMFGLRASR